MNRRDRDLVRAVTVTLALYIGVLLACTAPSTGENNPGDDTNLDPEPDIVRAMGDVAVQPDESRVWVVHQRNTVDEYGNVLARKARLAAVDTHTGEAVNLADVANTTDRWMLFPTVGRALLMDEQGWGERFTMYDASSLDELSSATIHNVSYDDPKTSPSGRWVAATNRVGDGPSLHIVATDDIAPIEIRSAFPDRDIETAWTHGSDYLLALHGESSGTEGSWILGWNLEGESPSLQPDLQIELPDLCLTWGSRIIAVSPDDHWAAFALVDCQGADPLVIVNLTDGSYRVTDLLGPVTFTPDSSTIVGHYYDGDVQYLQLIDVQTLSSELVPLPVDGAFEYFVSWDGNLVVVTPLWDGGQLVLYDATSGETTQVEGPNVQLKEFAYRESAGELWIADSDQVHRLRLADATLEPVPLSFYVRHLGLLRTQDRLALTPPTDATLRFYDLAAGAVDLEVALPEP